MPKATPEIAAPRATMGRPRKYSDDELVDAALRVLERQGYAALTIRALAQELGTSHSTLYNYVERVEDIESKAVHKLTAQLPFPSASTPRELRAELLDYLIAAWRMLLQHPGVLFPPMKSPSWNTLFEIGERWVQALVVHAPDEETARLALGALVSTAVVHAERVRVYGSANAAATRKAAAGTMDAVAERLEGQLDKMVSLVLPALDPRRKAGR